MRTACTAGLLLLALVVVALQLYTLSLQNTLEARVLLSVDTAAQTPPVQVSKLTLPPTKSPTAGRAAHVTLHQHGSQKGAGHAAFSKAATSKQDKLQRQRQKEEAASRRQQKREERLQELYGNYTVFSGNFTGSVAMNQASVPQVGRPLLSPWRVFTSGHQRSLGRVTQRLLGVLPPTDPFAGVCYPSCAVVGSAGLLLTQRFGHEIDAHAAVLRFNLAPTKGFEQHVGGKTTIRLVNRKHFGFRETAKETVLQHITLAEVLTDFVKLRELNSSLPTYGLDMSFYEQVIDWRRVQQPTNGFVGLKLALILCNRVTVYGFMRSYRGWFKYHYFDDEEPNDTQYSRDNQGEVPIIQEIMAQYGGRVTFRHPCILDQTCSGCPIGATCDGITPFAVPRPGFCKPTNGSCIAKCGEQMSSCPGGRNSTCGAVVDVDCETT